MARGTGRRPGICRVYGTRTLANCKTRSTNSGCCRIRPLLGVEPTDESDAGAGSHGPSSCAEGSGVGKALREAGAAENSDVGEFDAGTGGLHGRHS
jgi:hypothetical protein